MRSWTCKYEVGAYCLRTVQNTLADICVLTDQPVIKLPDGKVAEQLLQQPTSQNQQPLSESPPPLESSAANVDLTTIPQLLDR
jgi:hypothetical protein